MRRNQNETSNILSVTDTLFGGVYDTTAHTWHDTVDTRTRNGTTTTWTKKTLVDQALLRGAYVTIGYVVLPKLRVAARADLFRTDYSWKLDTLRASATVVDTFWVIRESRNLNWTLSADYFLNPNTKVTLNYDIKQEDIALPLVKNNVISLQAQVKF